MEQMGEALRQTQGDGDVRSRDDSTHEGISVSRTIARLMMLVNAAVWGSGYTMLKHVQGVMTTQWMMFFRMAASVILMALVFLPHLRKIGLKRYIVPGLVLALTYWMGFLLQLKGLETTSPGVTASSPTRIA